MLRWLRSPSPGPLSLTETPSLSVVGTLLWYPWWITQFIKVYLSGKWGFVLRGTFLCDSIPSQLNTIFSWTASCFHISVPLLLLLQQWGSLQMQGEPPVPIIPMSLNLHLEFLTGPGWKLSKVGKHLPASSLLPRDMCQSSLFLAPASGAQFSILQDFSLANFKPRRIS